MIRREALGWLGAGTVGLMAGELVAEASPGQEAAAQQPHRHDPVHDDCLKACVECARACNEMFRHCFALATQGRKEHARPATIALDCAEFCGLSVSLMSRDSELMVEACQACADACKRCAEECAKFSDDPMMKLCAETCRRCETACRQMVRALSGRAGR